MKNKAFNPSNHEITDLEAQEIKGGKVAPDASLADVDCKSVCILSSNTQITGPYCDKNNVGDTVGGETIIKKTCIHA